jgi:hypothetical protein
VLRSRMFEGDQKRVMIRARGLGVAHHPGLYPAVGFDELRAASTILRTKRFSLRTSDPSGYPSLRSGWLGVHSTDV